MTNKKEESLNELEHRNADLGLFTETRLRPNEEGESNEEGENYIFLNATTTVRGVAGVSLAVKKSLRYALKDWGTVKDRIIWADFSAGKIAFRFIGVYFPTARKKHLNQSQKLYDQLQKLCQKGIVFLAGDFNARLPTAASDCHWGKFGNCHVQLENKNSKLLTEFCQESGFKSLASKFRKNRHGYATWRHPNPTVTRRHHQIDHFLCRQATANSATDCRVIHDAIPQSDHKPLLVTIDIKAWKWFPRVPPQKMTMIFTREKEKMKDYNDKVREGRNEGDTIKEAIANAAEATFRCQAPSAKPWRSEKYAELASKMRELLLSGKKSEAKEMRPILRKQEAADERAHYEKICEEANEKYKKSGIPPTMREISKYFGKKAKKGPHIDPPIRDNNGIQHTSTDKKLKIHTAFYNEVFGATPPSLPPENSSNAPHRAFPDIDPDLHDREIKKAVKGLNSGKVPAVDRLTKEMIMLLDEDNNGEFYKMIHKVWEVGYADQEDIDSIIAILPKPGKNTQLADAWRPIALLALTNKVINRILYGKLRTGADSILSEEQNGFRAHRSTIDHVLTVRIVCQESARTGKPVFMCFVDLRQAFDRVPRNLIQRVMDEYKLDPKLQEVFWNGYKDHSFRVKRNGKLGESTKTNIGLKQGCVLSPIIFNLCLQYILDRTDLGDGLSFHFRKDLQDVLTAADQNDNETLSGRINHLLFADDIVLKAQSFNELVKVVTVLSNSFKQFGLLVNNDKTKYMAVDATGATNKNLPDKTPVPGGHIAKVSEFTYLGSVFTADGSDDRDIEERLSKGSQKFGALRKVFFSRHLPKHLKFKILKTFVLPAATYGSNAWRLTQNQQDTLDTWWMHKLRITLGVTKHDHLTNSDILNRFHTEKLSTQVRKLRMRYVGHVIRYPISRYVRQALTMHSGLPGTRGRKTFWTKQVNKDLNISKVNCNTAFDRDGWKWKTEIETEIT